MKSVILLGTLVLFVSCSTPEQDEFERIRLLPLHTAVYKTSWLNNDSVRFDTLSVAIQDGNFMTTFTNDRNLGQKMQLYYLNQPYQTNNDGDSVMRRTYINYDLIGDSIRCFEKTEGLLGESKTFEINGELHKVLKQGRYYFTKSEDPNYYDFYTKQFGIIVTLSEKRIRELTEWPLGVRPENMEALIRAVKSDTAYFNMEKTNIEN